MGDLSAAEQWFLKALEVWEGRATNTTQRRWVDFAILASLQEAARRLVRSILGFVTGDHQHAAERGQRRSRLLMT
jgi:hypothetical protein